MPTVLNTNVASLRAADNLLGAQEKLASSVERLSSGSRINRAKDDAAGLGVSQSLTRQINGANQGIRNLNDGISMVQTAEAAISAAMEMGQRILMLATQGANGTLGTTERTAIRDEMRQLAITISAISGRTTYSGNNLLSVSTAVTTGNLYTLQTTDVTTDTIGLSNKAFWNIGAGASTAGPGATPAETVADSILGGRADFTNGQAYDVVNKLNAGNMTSGTASDATAAFRAVITAATTYVTNLGTQRSLLGAYQNQIEYTVSNVTELSSNLTAARSRVTDTDYAAETAALTKGQILQQASTAMLAQANQMPNVILTLLK
jgi:flagellin